MIERHAGANGNAYSISKRLYESIRVTPESIMWSSKPLDEGKMTFGDQEKGGVIVFSTDVNAVQLQSNKLVDWLKKKRETLKNRITSRKKIDKVAVDNDLIGWTIGKFLNGRYKAKNGQQYGENSLSVEIVGIDSEALEKIALELCKEFKQESVMVKDYITGEIYFAEP